MASNEMRRLEDVRSNCDGGPQTITSLDNVIDSLLICTDDT